MLSVFFAVAIFANGDGGIFHIKKGTKVSGLQQVFVAPSKILTTVFYVKEKTVFHEGKNTAIKVVYLSENKKVASNEKVVTTVYEPKVALPQKNTQAQVAPSHRRPFQVGYFGLYHNNRTFVFPSSIQYLKNHRTTSSTTQVLPLKNALTKSRYTSSTHTHKTSKYTTGVLNILHSRPPPSWFLVFSS